MPNNSATIWRWSGRTWEAYARRHGLDACMSFAIPRVRRMRIGENNFALELPEFNRFDAALVLDNDIVINPQSPVTSERWDPARVLIGDRTRTVRVVGGLRPRNYFAYYDLFASADGSGPRVHNTGVLAFTHEHLPFFWQKRHERWRRVARRRDARKARAGAVFKFANDQPHVGLALQTGGLAQSLEMKFNRLWWELVAGRAAGAQNGHLRLTRSPRNPHALSAARSDRRALAAPGLRAIDRALGENYFLHFAGSKSPLHLLAHRQQTTFSHARAPRTGHAWSTTADFAYGREWVAIQLVAMAWRYGICRSVDPRRNQQNRGGQRRCHQ